MNSDRSREIWKQIVLILLVLAAYSSAFTGEFQFDDELYITGGTIITRPAEYLSGLGLREILSPGGRPLTFNVVGYHAVNILLHLVAVFLVWALLRRVLRGYLSDDIGHDRVETIAWLGAAVFALHPLQTQAVTYIVQRAEVLASLFYVAGLLLMIRFIEAKGGRSGGYWCMAMCSFLLGWASKEIIVTMPVMLLLYAVYFMDRGAVKKALLGLSPMIIAGIVLGIRLVAGFQGSEHVGFDMEGLGQREYLYTQFRVLVTYLRLLFVPVGQTIDHDYPVYREFLDPHVVLSFLFWVAVVAGSVLSLRVKGRWRWHVRAMGFGMLWYLVVLMPTSSLVPLRDVIFEHRVYLAMVGVVLSTLSGVDMVLIWVKERYGYAVPRGAVIAAIVVVLVALGGAAYARNMVWQTKMSLWKDAVAKAPNKSRPHNNLGQIYLKNKLIPEAEAEFLTAVRLDPTHITSYNNLGMVYREYGDLARAEKYFRMAIGSSRDYADPYINLGTLYAQAGRLKDAVREFEAAIRIKPSNFGILNNLGITYAQLKDYKKAKQYLLEAVRLNPSFADAYNNLGIVHMETGMYREAAGYFERSLKLNYMNPPAHYYLGQVSVLMGDIVKAKQEYIVLRSMDTSLAKKLLVIIEGT